MDVYMGVIVVDDDDGHSNGDKKMGANAKNPVVTKTAKKEEEWSQSLSDGCVCPTSIACPIIIPLKITLLLNLTHMMMLVL